MFVNVLSRHIVASHQMAGVPTIYKHPIALALAELPGFTHTAVSLTKAHIAMRSDKDFIADLPEVALAFSRCYFNGGSLSPVSFYLQGAGE